MYLYLFVLFLVLLVYWKLIIPQRYWKERHVPTGKFWPLIGHMGPYIFQRKSFADWVKDIYNACEGRYVGIYHFAFPSIVIKDLEVIKKIAIKDFDYFTDHSSFISEELDPYFAKNLFFLKGQKWKEMRSTLSPAFTGSKMRGMFLLMRDCAENFTSFFSGKSDNGEVILEMKDMFTKYTNDVIASCAFGIECDSLRDPNNEFYIKGKDVSNFRGFRFFVFLGYMIFPGLMKFLGIRFFDKDISSFYENLVMNNIKVRENEGIVRTDVIHLLMEARKGKLKCEEPNVELNIGYATTAESIEEKQQKIGITNEDVVAQAMVFLIAGFQTVSVVLSFLCYELAINPEVQQKLQEEIDKTKNQLNGCLTYESLTKMKYLDMVVTETLRKWPPNLMTDRICVKPYVIEPSEEHEPAVNLIKGDALAIPTYAIQRNPKYYPNPEKFDPERFNDENKGNIHPIAYTPFGIGPRNCIGSRFALVEIKVLIYFLLSQFDIMVTEKTQIPLKLSTAAFDLCPEKGIWLKLQKRTSVPISK